MVPCFAWLRFQLEHLHGGDLCLLVDIGRRHCTLEHLGRVENSALNSRPVISAAAKGRSYLIIADDLLEFVVEVGTPHERLRLVLLA